MISNLPFQLAQIGEPTRRFATSAFRSVLYLSFGCLLLANAGCNSEKRSKELVKQATKESVKGNHAEAEALALKAAKADPKNGEAWVLAGNAARDAGKISQALEHYAKTPDSDEPFKVESHVRAATLLMENQGQLTKAEEEFRKALAIEPGHKEGNDGMAYLMSISGRRWESATYFLALIRPMRFEIGHLFGIGVLETTLHDTGSLERWASINPDGPLPKLGLARIAIDNKDLGTAKQLLQEIIDDRPDLLEAQARYGQVLVQQNDVKGLIAWNQSLPEKASEHPEIWAARGDWRLLVGDEPGALRCYAEAFRLNPNMQQSAFQLVRLMQGEGDTELASVIEQRARALLAYQETLVKLQGDQTNYGEMARAAQLAHSLGRYWESRGWMHLAKQLNSSNQIYDAKIAELNETLSSGPPQTLESASPLATIDLAQWPVPDWTSSPVETLLANNPGTSTATIRFRDIAEQGGLDFTYHNAKTDQRPGPYLYQVDGGGVGVLDFDLDAQPDLWFTQGCEFPIANPNTTHVDRLFRNRDGTSVIDVTEVCGLRETGFGQGVTVGDFDNDGFPDVFVANIGENRLFHNLGDGTFEELSANAGISGGEWTASCAMADLNRDGLPDLYEVNYLAGEDIHERICPDAAGTPRICPPIDFNAEYDKVYLNKGDGTFEDASERLGFRKQSGKGLGIVIADFDESNQLSVFVANDVVQNFYFRSTTDPDGNLIYEEIGLLNGLATDGQGQSQACMGVAVDDANGDGRLDLFVTNFHEESNTLYIQQQAGLFGDLTARALLSEPSFLMLGFGTQFTDMDLDGRPDVVIANGHLVDETDLGVPYRMRPQAFRQLSSGQFDELPASETGDYFANPALGRGLALLDFNRDGKEDFAVTDLSRPASLVINESEGVGNWLSVRLISKSTARDPIGATVKVKCEDSLRYRQLTSGSGYQASNESVLNFGLGDADIVQTLTVKWPSGVEQDYHGIRSGQHIVIVEGSSEVQAIP